MNTKGQSIAAALSLTLALGGVAPAEQTKPRATVNASNVRLAAPNEEISPRFVTDLYAELRKTEGNVFFSPHSITEAMGMAYMGSEGDTAAEFVKVMGYDPVKSTSALQQQLLRDTIIKQANQKDNELSIANALCVTGRLPTEQYMEEVRYQFGAEIFNGGLEKINAWVNKQTHGNIEEILTELDPNSACVLLNAVYFKGNWKHAFDPKDTMDGDFHVSADKVVQVPLMSQTDGFATAYSETWVAAELPYTNSCSMVLLMPKKADGLKALEASLDEALVKKVCDELKQAGKWDIRLVVPKFKIETKYDLVPAMKQLDMKDAFNLGQANFKAMYDKERVAISQIVHKATLEVNEEGSVASAATALEMKAESMPMTMAFDRPFLVLIREQTTNSTLFMGRISDPSK